MDEKTILLLTARGPKCASAARGGSTRAPSDSGNDVQPGASPPAALGPAPEALTQTGPPPQAWIGSCHTRCARAQTSPERRNCVLPRPDHQCGRCADGSARPILDARPRWPPSGAARPNPGLEAFPPGGLEGGLHHGRPPLILPGVGGMSARCQSGAIRALVRPRGPITPPTGVPSAHQPRLKGPTL